jgi:WD40 repeat protein
MNAQDAATEDPLQVDAGRLGELIRDPAYLAAADPARLMRALQAIGPTDGVASRYANIYEQVAERLVGLTPSERAPMLHMSALMEEPDLAPAFKPNQQAGWHCQWARVRAATRHHVLVQCGRPVMEMALGFLDGLPVIAAAVEDMTIRVWNMLGEAVGATMHSPNTIARHLALGTVDGRLMIAGVGVTGKIRRFDARTGEEVGSGLPPEHLKSVGCVAFGVVDGRTIIVAGSDKSVRRWDARTGDEIAPRLEGHGFLVTSIAFGVVEGRPIMVTASADRTIRRWDARNGATLGPPLQGHEKMVSAVALGALDGRDIIVSGSWDKTIRLWNAQTGAPVGRPIAAHDHFVTSVALAEFSGRMIVASGSMDRTVRLWDARTGRQIGRTLVGHHDRVHSVAIGVAAGEPIIASTGSDGTIRVWDIRAAEQSGSLDLDTPEPWCISLGAVEGRPIVATGGDYSHAFQMWDGRTGGQISRTGTGHGGMVTSMAFGAIEGIPVIATGSQYGVVGLWDVRRGEEILRLSHGDADRSSLIAVAIGAVDGRPLIAAGKTEHRAGIGDQHNIYIWDAQTGEPTRDPIDAHNSHIWSLVFGEVDTLPIVVSGAYDGAICVWDARTGDQIGWPLPGHDGIVAELAFGALDRRPVFVSGGSDGAIRVWDAETRVPIGVARDTHPSAITFIALGALDGRQVIVSAGVDGTIRIWDARSMTAIGTIALGSIVKAAALHDEFGLAVATWRGPVMLSLGGGTQSA